MKPKQTVAILRRWIIQFVLFLGLIWGITGCASVTSRAATSEPASAVSACDAKKVTVTGVHWFQDKGGAWRVVGIITNHSSKAVSKLETGVETRTSSDQAADQGEDIAAYPLNLQPGQQALFTAWIDREIPGLDHFEVEVAECVLAEPAERSQVNVHGSRLTVDDAGTAQLTAELYNPDSRSVLVDGLMAGVYDQAGLLITAQYVDVTPRYLAAGESGPVRASLDLPEGAGPKVSSYKLFMDVLVNQPDTLPLEVKRDVQILSHYTDKAGHFHLIGQITNPMSQGLMTSLQATVYSDSSKHQVMDASNLATWVPLMPGESLPFDFTDWGPLNSTQGLGNKLDGENTSIDLRIEPFLTWTTAANVKNLSLADGTVSFKDQQVLFTGKVKNDTSSGLTTAMVTAVLRRKSNGQIVAVGGAHLGITDSAGPGNVLNYSFTVPLPANLDSAGLETEITAKGFQP